ncbi:MAG: metallophosphoesterase family protein [Anaerolineae bacterium]
MPTSALPFTFIVVTDAHIRLDTDSQSGDYPSNQAANGRNRRVVQQINQLKPDLVIHLGDFVHPIPALPAFEPAMQTAYALYQDLDADLHVLPGNHDIGDKPDAWVPAPAVTEESHTVFERTWGLAHASFDHKGCHFILLNTPILNSGLPREVRQRKWLEQDLAANQKRGSRVFLFLHYPLYLTHPQESAHYDNIGQPARAWLLSLLAQYQVEAVFAGHVHNFFYNRYHDTDLYVLPSVTFVRPEYSELFAVEPAAEYGRDDAEKLGFCQVTVDPAGYRLQLTRTHGAAAETAPSRPIVLTGRQGGSAETQVGVFLRQAWADPIPMSYGNLDEFGRKRVRNDYLLWALWDLGIRLLRVPLDDLADDSTRERMEALCALGHAFTVFSVGFPDRQIAEMMARHHRLIAAWELILPGGGMAAAARRIQSIKKHTPVPVFLSQLETLEAQRHEQQASQIDHFPRHGFPLAETALPDAVGAGDGIVFRLTADTSPWEGIRAAQQRARAARRAAAVHVQMPRSSEGVAYTQDLAIATHVAETMIAAAAMREVTVFLDTFVDHDRGYYPRHGLLDKRYNPRPGYHLFRHLQRVLEDGRAGLEVSRIAAAEGVAAFVLETGAGRQLLLLSCEEDRGSLDIAWSIAAAAQGGVGRWLDLQTGQFHDAGWRPSPDGAGWIRIHRPTTMTRFFPALFSLP